MRRAHTGQMRRLLTLVLVLAACGAPPAALPTAAPSEPVLTPIPRAEIIEPSQGLPPQAAPPPARAPHVEPPVVAVRRTEFPITGPSGALVQGSLGELTEPSVRWGLTSYLGGLDTYRTTGQLGAVQLTGAFRDAVLTSIDATKRPGVTRKFELTSFRIERVWVKPWGTQALVDVMATITDTVVAGSAAPEVETGLLRLSGDRNLIVIDAWTGSRWFNGFPSLSRVKLLTELDHTFGWYVQAETWMPGTQAQQFFAPGGETPFSSARNVLLQKFDRQAIASRLLADVTATVQHFETLTDVGDGIATVRLEGTVASKDGAGVETRAPFTKSVRAFRKSFANGSGHFTVIDELGQDGRWLSGGDIALKDIDRSFG